MIENGSVFDFGDGCEKVTVEFDGVVGTSLLYLRLDSEDGAGIATVALAPTDGASGRSVARIAKTSGKRKVFFTNRGGAQVVSLRFHNDPDNVYTPAPECDASVSDVWVATDMLGRKLPEANEVGERNGKRVGIFYWTWRESFAHKKPANVTKVLAQSPDAEFNRDDPAWGGDDSEIQCHWNEPLYGFYRNSDPYVIRKHASMLSAAGVDFLVFDCTNGSFLWTDAYEPLLNGLHEAMLDGISVPKVAFMLNFAPFHYSEDMLRALYQNMYGIGKYSDLWYYVDGKPLVMAYRECLPEKGICDEDTKILDDMREFFTFRAPQPLYGRENGGPSRPDHWGWLEIAPQNKYGEHDDGGCEMMTVGVAQNASPERICTYFNDKNTFGRSYTNKFGHKLMTDESYKYGYNVQEQWDNALQASPDRIFITGWNEWCIGLHRGEPWVLDPKSTQLAMVDQYDRERSRDIEPDADGYLDTYYLQMAANVRRFKGACKQQAPSAECNITDPAQWESVLPVYKNHKGTAAQRDWDGFKGTHYTNNTGVNDIIEARVCRSSEEILFFARCSENIKDACKENMMTLYIDSDRNKCTGWEGYDIRINGLDSDENGASVELYTPTSEENSFTWVKIGSCKMDVKGDMMWLTVSRTLIGLERKLNIEFKWSDNLTEKNAMDFYVNGCAAPIGRFNYLFKEI